MSQMPSAVYAKSHDCEGGKECGKVELAEKYFEAALDCDAAYGRMHI